MRRDALPLDDLQQEHISYLLALWHRWSKASDRVGRGYQSVSCGFGAYRVSRQYDDANGAIDDAADMSLARAVDGVISKIDQPWRTALHVEARNIDAPARVWATARIDLADLQRVTGEAREMLWDGMEKAGML